MAELSGGRLLRQTLIKKERRPPPTSTPIRVAMRRCVEDKTIILIGLESFIRLCLVLHAAGPSVLLGPICFLLSL